VQALTAFCRSADSSTITAELLPSSRVTFFMPAFFIMFLPTSAEPVKVIFSQVGALQ